MIDSGIKWPNETTTPRSYPTQSVAEIGQFLHSKSCRRAKLCTYFSWLLKEVTTASCRTVAFFGLQKNCCFRLSNSICDN